MDVLGEIHNGLIVSCQALDDEPLHGAMLMAAMAWAAKLGGAVGIRTNGVEEVEVIKRLTGLPVIGIKKGAEDTRGFCITPTFGHAKGGGKGSTETVG